MVEKVAVRRPRSNSLSSSNDSQPSKKRKRVSFASSVEAKVFVKNSPATPGLRPSSAPPGRSILRVRTPTVKKTESASPKKPRVKKARVQPDEKPPKQQEQKDDGAQKELKQLSKKPAPVRTLTAKPKGRVVVTKKQKEEILAMPKKERKAYLKTLRAARRPNFELSEQLKQLWEVMRNSKSSQTTRDNAVAKCCELIRGKAVKLVYAHDTTRILQHLLSLKRSDITQWLIEELLPQVVRMAQSQYARVCVLRMIKYGTKEQRATIIQAFRGHAVSIFRTAWGAEVLNSAWADGYMSAEQRFSLVSEFYSNAFVLFPTDDVKSFEQVWESSDETKRRLILKNLEEILESAVNKNTVKLALCHRLLVDYLTHCSEEQRTHMVDELAEKLPEMVHTYHGALVALNAIWHSPAKTRKVIVKAFKQHAVRAAQDEYAHRVLIGIFDAVDDTKLVNKCIVQELGNYIGDIARSKWGQKLLHYLVHPRDGRVMVKKLREFYAQGDGNTHSLKEAETRYAELFSAIVEPLCTFLAANMEEVVYGELTSLLVLNTLEPRLKYDLFTRNVPSELRISCYDALAELAAEEFVPMNEGRWHVVEDGHAHFVLSKLLKVDGAFEEDQRLATRLCARLSDEQLDSWTACNKGCFVLLAMVEHGGSAVQGRVRKAINVAKLRKYTSKGAKLLLTHFQSITD